MGRAGLPVRPIEDGRNVAMYATSIQCRPSGALRGPMVVSMRPLPPPWVARAILVTAWYSGAHGTPVHVGDPATTGVRDLAHPQFGDPPCVIFLQGPHRGHEAGDCLMRMERMCITNTLEPIALSVVVLLNDLLVSRWTCFHGRPSMKFSIWLHGGPPTGHEGETMH